MPSQIPLVKKQVFEGCGVDLEKMAGRIETHLAENGFEVAFSSNTSGRAPTYFIQARKRGVLRTTTGTRRSMDIRIEGNSDDFEVKLGTGEWGNNIIASAPLFVIPIIGITTTVAKIYTAKRFESSIWAYVKRQVTLLKNTAIQNNAKQKRPEQSEFDCDYIEGYPGWGSPVNGGTLVLEKEGSSPARLLFMAPDGEQITIPVAKIERASVITRKKGMRENDLLVELSCEGKDGKTVRPVLNLPDYAIPDILGTINKSAAKDLAN